MNETNGEHSYDPRDVEAAIDDAYRMAENLEEDYQRSVEEAVEKIENLPYAVHDEEASLGRDELRGALEGLNQLHETSTQTSFDAVGDVAAVATKVLGSYSGETGPAEAYSTIREVNQMPETNSLDDKAKDRQIIDYIGRILVETVYEPCIEETTEWTPDENEETLEESIEAAAEQSGIDEEVLEQGARSMARFKRESEEVASAL